MAEKSNFILNLSVLYRNTQKYFDKVLVPYDIGSGQLIFLLCVNENEGITMQEVTRISEVDKGTTTKSIQRLIDQGYIQAMTDEKDHRVKRLYTTEKANGIMNEIYDYRNQLRTIVARDIDFASFEKMLAKATENARNSLLDDLADEPDYMGIKIGGLQKMTLLDYPGKMACTIFMSGCNYKCPFCHNRDLVFIPERYEYFDPQEILDYLEKRKGILDGVCISGGEPLLQDGLELYISEIRKLGYQIKLDTNGGYPDRLKHIIESGLVDMVAMDIKNSPEKYAETLGMNKETFRPDAIRRSVEILKESNIEYEFRTTVVRELHTEEDMKKIGEWIGPCRHYYLQQFMDSGNLIQPGFTAYSKEEMEHFRDTIKAYIPNAELRGVKED